ncbi:hypothetical protein [Streptomyces sp. NPDC054962]
MLANLGLHLAATHEGLLYSRRTTAAATGPSSDRLNRERISVARLRRALAGMTLPRAADGAVSLELDADPVASAPMT